MKSKRKRRRYRKIISTNYKNKDPFIGEWEKTFGISYEKDLKYIDVDDEFVISPTSITQETSSNRQQLKIDSV